MHKNAKQIYLTLDFDLIIAFHILRFGGKKYIKEKVFDAIKKRCITSKTNSTRLRSTVYSICGTLDWTPIRFFRLCFFLLFFLFFLVRWDVSFMLSMFYARQCTAATQTINIPHINRLRRLCGQRHCNMYVVVHCTIYIRVVLLVFDWRKLDKWGASIWLPRIYAVKSICCKPSINCFNSNKYCRYVCGLFHLNAIRYAGFYFSSLHLSVRCGKINSFRLNSFRIKTNARQSVNHVIFSSFIRFTILLTNKCMNHFQMTIVCWKSECVRTKCKKKNEMKMTRIVKRLDKNRNNWI